MNRSLNRPQFHPADARSLPRVFVDYTKTVALTFNPFLFNISPNFFSKFFVASSATIFSLDVLICLKATFQSS